MTKEFAGLRKLIWSFAIVAFMVKIDVGPLGTIAAIILVIGIIGVLLLSVGNLLNLGSGVAPGLAGAAGQVLAAGWVFIVLAAVLGIAIILIVVARDREH